MMGAGVRRSPSPPGIPFKIKSGRQIPHAAETGDTGGEVGIDWLAEGRPNRKGGMGEPVPAAQDAFLPNGRASWVALVFPRVRPIPILHPFADPPAHIQRPYPGGAFRFLTHRGGADFP